MINVIIFTKPKCLKCSKLRNTLIEQSIPFKNIDIEQNKEMWEDIISQLEPIEGSYKLPMVFIHERQ